MQPGDVEHDRHLEGAEGKGADHHEGDGEVGQPDLLVTQLAHLLAEGGVALALLALVVRQLEEQHHGGNGAKRSDGEEGDAPAEIEPDGAAAGEAQQVGDGDAGDEQREGGAAAFRRHEADDDHVAGAEEHAVSAGRKQPRQQQQAVVGGDGAQHLGDREHDHQADQHIALRESRSEYRQHRPTDGDADGIGADQQARDRDGHRQILGERRQDAGDDELGRADCERSQRQGVNGDRHDYPQNIRRGQTMPGDRKQAG